MQTRGLEWIESAPKLGGERGGGNPVTHLLRPGWASWLVYKWKQLAARGMQINRRLKTNAGVIRISVGINRKFLTP